MNASAPSRNTAAVSRTGRGRPRMVAVRLWRMGRVALLVAAVLAIAYWLRFGPVQVRAQEVRRGEIIAEVMGTGTLEARVKASISPKISGRIGEVLVDQGDRVATGDLLLALDDEELRRQVEIAIASLAAADAALDRIKADKDRAVAVLQYATIDYERIRLLYEQSTAASVEFEKVTETQSIARAELARADAAIVEGQKDQIVEQKNLAYHQVRLADTRVAAPFDGLIVRRHRDPGDVVVPGSTVLTLISTDELWITAWVDETEIASMRPEQPARVIFRSQPDRSYPGRVARLGREADRETREFVVDVRVLELPENWAVGQRAEVYVETARKSEATLVAAEFVVRRNGVAGVLVLEDGRATWRPIKIGLRSRESVEVTDGVRAGQTVVLPAESGAALRHGQRVEPAP